MLRCAGRTALHDSVIVFGLRLCSQILRFAQSNAIAVCERHPKAMRICEIEVQRRQKVPSRGNHPFSTLTLSIRLPSSETTVNLTPREDMLSPLRRKSRRNSSTSPATVSLCAAASPK